MWAEVFMKEYRMESELGSGVRWAKDRLPVHVIVLSQDLHLVECSAIDVLIVLIITSWNLCFKSEI